MSLPPGTRRPAPPNEAEGRRHVSLGQPAAEPSPSPVLRRSDWGRTAPQSRPEASTLGGRRGIMAASASTLATRPLAARLAASFAPAALALASGARRRTARSRPGPG